MYIEMSVVNVRSCAGICVVNVLTLHQQQSLIPLRGVGLSHLVTKMGSHKWGMSCGVGFSTKWGWRFQKAEGLAFPLSGVGVFKKLKLTFPESLIPQQQPDGKPLPIWLTRCTNIPSILTLVLQLRPSPFKNFGFFVRQIFFITSSFCDDYKFPEVVQICILVDLV